MSYYQTITDNFDRLTDERWANYFGPSSPSTLPRPDWANIYLADGEGKFYPPGRELNSMIFDGADSRGVIMPDRLALDQNYPNPFNPSTRIAYMLPGFCRVRICIYDRLGRVVDIPVDGPMPAGRHILEWKPEDLPSGVYVCRIQADAHVKSIKLVLVK